MLAGLQPGFCRRHRILDRVAAGIPNFRFAPPLAFAADAVIGAEAHQLGCVANPFTAQLRSHVRKINITRMLIGLINADVSTGFAPSVVISNGFITAGWTESATRRKS